MPISVKCSCGQQIDALEQDAGRQQCCPQCGQPVAIPDMPPSLFDSFDENSLRLEPLVKPQPSPLELSTEPKREDSGETYALTPESAALEPRVGDQTNGPLSILGELGNYLVTPDDSVVQFVALSPDNYVAMAGVENVVCVLNLRDGTCLHRFLGHQVQVRSGCFTADGKMALSGDKHGDLFLWDVATAQALAHFPAHDGAVNQVACANGCSLAASAGADGTARLLNLKSGKLVHYIEEDGPGGVTSVAFARDDSLIATGSGGGNVRLWQTRRLKPVQSLKKPPQGKVDCVRFTSNDHGIVAAGIKSGWGDSWAFVTRWHRRHDLQKQRYSHDSECKVRNVQAIAFSPSGDILVCGGGPEHEYNSIQKTTQRFTPFKIASTTTGTVFRSFWGHMRRAGLANITCVNLSDDGLRAISGGNDGRVQVWGVGWM
jgi:WD40 repeat protein